MESTSFTGTRTWSGVCFLPLSRPLSGATWPSISAFVYHVFECPKFWLIQINHSIPQLLQNGSFSPWDNWLSQLQGPQLTESFFHVVISNSREMESDWPSGSVVLLWANQLWPTDWGYIKYIKRPFLCSWVINGWDQGDNWQIYDKF